ncbi:MAG: M56 family metallopeptidase [Bacteroidota bacterium]
MINHLSIPQYLLESSFCLAVFYLFYLIFLKKETYFQFNRLYLLGTALLSLSIPLLNVDFHTASAITGASQIYPILSQVNDLQIGIQQTISQESNVLHISISDVINWIYMAGFFIMTLKLFSGLFKLFGIINRSPKLKDQDHTLLISEDVPAASFFSYIFWKDKHDKSDPIQKTILDHEMVHVRQWHSLDVIIMEIMVIVKWFNPLIYLFRNSLKKTHEFIADRYVTNQMGDKFKYASILLKNSAPTNMPPISNHFYGNIKERIKMLGTKQSSRMQQLKYFAIIPMTLVLFSLFSFDLSDRLPQPIKNSLQHMENSMLAAIETSVISLNVDEENEKNVFLLKWGESMKMKLHQTFEIQDFLFSYSKSDLEQLLGSEPNISQNGKDMPIYIDTIEMITKNGKKHISPNTLQDAEFRKFLVDSLEKHDQITFGFKTFSDTDSLFIKLHLALHENQSMKYNVDHALMDETLRWGNRKIEFTSKYTVDGRRFNLDLSVTDEEITNMLDNKIEISQDSKTFAQFPDDATIFFTVSRADNSKLASLDAERIQTLLSHNDSHRDAVAMVSYYHGKKYTIQEESKQFTLHEFYTNKDDFKNWISTCKNGDFIRVKLESTNDEFGSYDFNLRYRDDNEAISAPFPIDMPHTTDVFSNFQLIMNDSGKSFIRVDTKDPENQKIVEAYSGSESYELIHIDDFKTKYRVKEHTLPRGAMENEIWDDLEVRELNILSLNDYYTSDDQLIRMDWGKMVSMPNIGNYSIKEFKRSSKEKLNLFVGTREINMVRFDLLIIPENGKIERIRTNNLSTLAIRETLNKVDINTSIYIDNIIIDVDEELKYYPYNFVFTVE